jgi:hypothetical protein
MGRRTKSRGEPTVEEESTRPKISGVDEAIHRNPWITRELFEENRRVWSKEYGHELSDDEVLEILLNIRRLAEALLYASQNRREPGT